MYIQISFNKMITTILIIFIVMALSVPQEVWASTVDPLEVISRFSEMPPTVREPFHRRTSSAVWPVENYFSGNKADLLERKGPLFYSEGDWSLRNKDSHLDMISGNFCLTHLETSEDSREHEHDWDDHHRDWEGPKDPPAPVSLPASVLLLGTGMALLAGISRIKKFNV